MKHLKKFETFSQDNIDEGWKEFGQAITKPFRKRTDEEVEKDAMDIISDPEKMNKLEIVLKGAKNPLHYKNFKNTKHEYDKGNEMPFLKFILFVKDHIGEIESNSPLYYNIDIETGDITDTGSYSYSTGPGGRSWTD